MTNLSTRPTRCVRLCFLALFLSNLTLVFSFLATDFLLCPTVTTFTFEPPCSAGITCPCLDLCCSCTEMSSIKLVHVITLLSVFSGERANSSKTSGAFQSLTLTRNFSGRSIPTPSKHVPASQIRAPVSH